VKRADRVLSVAEVDDARWERVFAVNVVSCMKLIHAADEASNFNGVILPYD